MKKGLLLILIIAVLAITALGFFMFTTTLSSPTQMTLHMPKDDGKGENKFADVKSRLTLILLKNDNVFGYYGDFIKGGKTVSIDQTSDLINDGWKMFSKDSLAVIIKPSKQATYKATVAVLDAMTTNKISRYTMVDIDEKEKEFLKIDE